MVDAGMPMSFAYVARDSLRQAEVVKQQVLGRAVASSTCFVGICWNKHSANESRAVISEMFVRASRFFKEPDQSAAFVRDIISGTVDGNGISLSDANSAMGTMNTQLLTLSLVGGALTYYNGTR